MTRAPRARSRTGSRFAHLVPALGALTLAALLLPAASAAAPPPLARLQGHLSFGYTRLLARDAPAGSMAVDSGIDVPLDADWSAGVTLGYALLGSRTVGRGSLIANLDYSVFEAIAFAHLQPAGLGPVGRLSFGPGLFSARATLSTSGGGAMFSDLAREEVVPGFALDATLMKRKPSPVRVGLELGTRIAFLKEETWTLTGVRLAFHY